ncbi:MAG: sulfatase-like hydrolase/transferase [Fimbriimonadaceae bacterium]|nr:sulfatase-like hydrolase/transferase [Chitinophagales bacterium]
MKTTTLFAVIILCLALSKGTSAQSQPNILFIVIDDLNDYVEDLGGHPQVETPNISEIADYGTLFTNAYSTAPQCAPSRTSFLTGKDLEYTQVYENAYYKCAEFSDNFTAAENNEEYFTIPGYLKDSAGYFTFGINKIFHCYDRDVEYDALTSDPCSKGLSWNRTMVYLEDDIIHPVGMANVEGIYPLPWSRLNDSLTIYLEDYVTADTVVQFINKVADGTANTCGKPFFLAVGIAKPHTPLYIPESYFSEFYQDDYYELPYITPYNNPGDAFPYNGIVMPPQPDPLYADYDNLPEFGVAQNLASAAIYNHFRSWRLGLSPMPVVDASISPSEKAFILEESKRANGVMAYLAAIKFADEQIGKIFDGLQANPAVFNNTIVILISDHGFSLGEKKHWKKESMWETDSRVPFIIADLRNVHQQVCTTSVSLLDIFPTVCDMVGVEKPRFSDNTNYLDGLSILPLLTNADLKMEKPSLSSFKGKPDTEGSCNPQYSVRNNQFHYIQYKSNNIYSVWDCDSSASITEEELYEIGSERNVDPNEWNNLIADEDYAIVKKYLAQWLPDSVKYLKKTFSIDINNSACSYKSTDNVVLTAKISSKEGVPFSGIPATKHLRWWTNLSDDTSLTTTFSFSLASIPEIIAGTENEVLVYTALYNSDYSIIESLIIQHIKINNTASLYPSFKVRTKKKKATITNVVYPSGTTTATWNYGDGFIYTGLTPPLHTYVAYGNYTVTCTASIGACTVSKQIAITLDAGSHIYSKISPNPVKNELNIYVQAIPGNLFIEIYNASGVKMMEKQIESATGIENVLFNTETLPAGNYFVKIKGADFSEVQEFIKVK